MDGQRPSSLGRRNRKRSRQENKPTKTQRREEPILIAARRPDSPAIRPKRRFIAASAVPKRDNRGRNVSEPVKGAGDTEAIAVSVDAAPRRVARIVQVNSVGPDDKETARRKLIGRLLASEGRAAISRAANELTLAGFEFPVAQDVQLQLLEHFDEGRAYQAICHLADLLKVESPIKRPLFEQRLRRLEEFADDSVTREAAADLRRTVRA
jgi:hypothetical protein